MTHRILAEHPTVLALTERDADLEAARRVFLERQQKRRAEHEAAVAEHWRAVREAVLAGEPPPPEPIPPPDESDQARLFLDEQGKLRIERRELLASLADELEPAAEARAAELLDRVRPHVAEIEEVAVELAELVSTMRHLRMLRERHDSIAPGEGLSDRMRTRVTPADVVNAVIRGERLLDPVKPPRRQGVVTSVQ